MEATFTTIDEGSWQRWFSEPTSPVFPARLSSGEPATVHTAVWSLSESIWERLEQLVKSNGCTIADFLLTAVAICVSRTHTVEDGVVIGLTGSNRETILPLQIRVATAAGFIVNMKNAAAERQRALQHARVPLGRAAAAAGEPGPRVDVLLSMDRHPTETAVALTLALRRRSEDHDGSSNALLVCGNSRFLSLAEVERLQRQLSLLSQSVLAGETGSASTLPLMSDAERRQVLFEWNGPQLPYPNDVCMHALFERHARLTPLATALEQDGRTLSYRALNRQANRLARHLRALDIKSDERVAICMPHCFELLVAMLAVSKAGGAYVPLDPSYPQERRDYLLADSGARALLIVEQLRKQQPVRTGLTVLSLDGPSRPWEERSGSNLRTAASRLSSHHLIYVIYTSGSTGEPKGVMVEHRHLANLVSWHSDRFELGLGKRTSSTAGVAFDACAWEVWPALCTGATLVIPPQETSGDPTRLLDWWVEQELDSSFLVTALAEMALSRGVPSKRLRSLLTGGDRLSRPPAKEFPFDVINNYGPTETTVVATSGRIDPNDKVLHIGRPIANTKIYLLDTQGQPVPVGVAGEIHIGGAGVARGYLNQPELTRERFLTDPFSREPEARMYKTGDLARWLPDGTLEFLGRNDHQVKIRGFRIELGEVEAQLKHLPGVREAVVSVHEGGPASQLGLEKRLVAYLVGEGLAKPLELRAELSKKLPPYMVPSAYVTLDDLPLTANGKLDRKALPAPEAAAFSQQAYEAPQGPIETALAEIWREVLQVERVGRQDHFFELGGHSLSAVQLMERLRQQGLHADIRTLFSQPTLAGLAQAVGQARSGGAREVVVPPNGIAEGCTAITAEMLPLVQLTAEQIARIVETVPGGAANIQDIYPLAPLQEGILFHHLLGQQGDPYLVSTLLAFDTRARFERFVQALQVMIDRHDVLRTGVLWEGLPEPVLVVRRRARIEVEMLELSGEDIPGQLSARSDPAHYRLDVRQAPQMRGFAAFDSNQQRWLLVLLQHHLTMDHITSDLLMQEAAWIQAGRLQELATPVPFREFVAQARRGVSEQEHEEYFRQMLGDVQEPTAPFGLKDVQGEHREIREAHRVLDRSLSQRIRRQVKVLGVSAASVFHWAWAQVLSKTTGREDVVFGTVLFGRTHAGARSDRAMGLFINTLPLRIRLDEKSVGEGVRHTHELLANLVWHEHASLALAQRCSALPASTPLFSALLNYYYSASAIGVDEEIGWGEGVEMLSFKERATYAFSMSVGDSGHEDFQLSAQIAQPIDAQRMCDYMHRALTELMDALEQEPQAPAWRIGILEAAERDHVLRVWNDTKQSYPQNRCVQELFEQHVAQTPQALALEQGDQRLSYQELNERANRLAHYLIGLGVEPEGHVALALERGPEMVVAMLATLKAGGAYVPLDPQYPAERLAFMLEDCRPKVVLTHSAVQDRLRASRVPSMASVVELDDPVAPWQKYSDLNPDPIQLGLRANSLAYVIYTSGSTGQPKGVMAEHRNVANLATWHAKRFELNSGKRTSCTAGVAFDACVWEIWPALCGGAALVLPPRETSGDPLRLLDWWAAQELDSSFLVTALAEMALKRGVSSKRLRSLTIGGDRLTRGADRDLPFEVVNNYGPAETTVCATSGRIDPDDEVLHIGRPIANTKIYLLDAQGQPVPVGVTGEIHVGGASVVRGYLNRPELTEERFLVDPFSGEPEARMYKTGDLARWLHDGRLEFMGRNDYQVKIRGFRIELGEIEAQLRRLAGVHEAVVNVYEPGAGDWSRGSGDVPRGEKRLVAYLVGEGLANPRQLSAELAKKLPSHMVPVAYVTLDALPLNSNGKLNRNALPAPDEAALSQRAYEAPQGSIETALAEIWCELLHVERVGRQDHFFELGGHSLSAVQLMSRVSERLKRNVTLPDLFSAPLLSDFAQMVGEAATDALPPLTVGQRPSAVPMSFAQQRLWLVAQISSQASAALNNQRALRLTGVLNEEVLRAALARVVQRHESLRTRFELVDGQPVQRIVPIGDSAAFSLVTHDLTGLPDAQEMLRDWRRLEAREAFDLGRGPLVRGRLLRLGPEDHVLLLTMHHIVWDGWSEAVLIRELNELYRVYMQEGAARESDPLPPLPMQYADYTLWQRRWLEGDVLQSQLAYWRDYLQGAPSLLELPTDRARPAVQDHTGGSLHFHLDAELGKGLRELSHRHGTTLYITLLASVAAMLSRLSGQRDIIIGTPMVNRTRTELEPVIGMFVNTLALRVNLSSDPSVSELLAHVREITLAAQAHKDLPFEQVVELVNPVRSLAYTPLYQAVFVMQNTPDVKWALPGLRIDMLKEEEVGAPTDLWWSVTEVENGGFDCAVVYAKALFDAETLQRWTRHWLVLLRAMVTDQEQSVSRLPLLSVAERQLILRDWNDTATPFASDHCLHELFEEQVQFAGETTALVCEAVTLTYAELNSRANRLAHHLIATGVRPNNYVAIALERGPEMVVAMLATLKAGGAYVPLDPQYPSERLAFMLEDSCPTVVLTTSVVRKRLPTTEALMRASLVQLDDASAPWLSKSDVNPAPAALGLTPDHLAYVIYTSGSTGRPKGVMVPHRGLCNQVLAQAQCLAVEPGSRVLQCASFSFDASIFEMMLGLCHASTLYLPVADVVAGQALIDAITRYGITHVTLTPAVLMALDDEAGLASVRTLVAAGDFCPQSLVARWARGRLFINTYGATEVTIWSNAYACDADAVGHPPVGRPIANYRIYVLDEHRQPVPIGVTGEIYIGGLGVAPGYLNRPELTQERFLNDPFAEETGARMYKTGDLGRLLPDGTLAFVGRNDFQVKIRGFRIELGEIEAQLARQPGVREAVVLVREDNARNGEAMTKRLVAYLVGDQIPDAQTLRTALATELPDYMMPSAFVSMEAWPLTPNGKLDRKALPNPEDVVHTQRQYEAPQGSVEATLAEIWSELLEVERVGRGDHFFELGGHSLLATQLTSRVRQRLGLEVALASLFAKPVLSELAALLSEAESSTLPAIPTGQRPSVIPLSFVQEGLWFFAQMSEAASAAYHIASGLRLRGRLNETALQAALDRIVHRHEVLRTHYELIDGEPAHCIKQDAGFALARNDLSTSADPHADIAQWRRLEERTRFNLASDPPIRGRLLRLSEQDHVLLLTVHHIGVDGWSMGVLMRELAALYRAYTVEGVAHSVDPLQTLPVQYADYVVWERQWLTGSVQHQQLAYWETQLAGAPTLLELPTDRPRPPIQDHTGGTLSFSLDAALSNGLRALSQRHGTTLYMTLLAGWAAMLNRLSGQNDMVIGTAGVTRTQAELEPLIGFFVNTLALRIDLTGNPTVIDLLTRVRDTTLAAQAHKDVPFQQVVETLKPVRSLAHSPLYQVAFVMQNTPDGALRLPGIEVESLIAENTPAQIDMWWSVTEVGEHIEYSVVFATALFDAETVQRWSQHWTTLLQAIVADATQSVSSLPLLSPAERQQILQTWNDTQRAYPGELGVVQRFESHTARDGEATALVCEEQTLSYAELNARANRLAHYLIVLGIKPDGRIALALERGPEMVVAMLAALKAGGAYVPLDPHYPAERLAFMLEDSRPKVVLTHSTVQERLPASRALTTASVVELDDPAAPWQKCSDANPEPAALGVKANNLAYVIYTSGSTGQPKGVMVEHGNLANLVAWHSEHFALQPGERSPCTAGVAFDACTWEVWPPLCMGATLSLPPASVAADPEKLLKWWQGQELHSSFLVTALAEIALSNANASIPRGLRTLLTGGDRLSRLPGKNLPFEVINNYGPTETAVVATSGRIKPDDAVLHIGRPIANTKIYLLDAQGQPSPVGVAGEIHIGGAGVARGYLNQPELTRERFLADPFSAEPGARMYKTGDLARWRSDGTLEFLGRNDQQVKIRGFRIELGEIEAQLKRSPGVREAVVSVHDARLVAFLTGEGIAPAAELRSALAQLLPEYMVPSAYVVLDQLPLTANGKVDRKALPEPEGAVHAQRAYAAPQSPIEITLAGIWSELLQVERIGRHDHFFDLGGHSLLATQLISRIRREWELDLPLAEVFSHPTLSALSRVIVDCELAAIDPQEMEAVLSQYNAAQKSLET